jgi:hypothetical protein
MWKKISEEKKRKYYIIIFLVLPLCFVIGFIISTKFAFLLNYKVNLKGMLIVTLSLLPLYIMSVVVVYRKFVEQGDEKKGEPR